ncbi:DUF1848 family protein [uncultured Desulfosarcina sp.]|uniref:DUF1848 family protein n=1 Tax=uncultured Desulfosarcina sp. TaxID=218289 RepID=UPI0029C6147E|nr:DUF1848 family protein [uncultured Desulfosarcina sp.]
MIGELKQILSVSRRTDIPAFYMTWFMDQVARGFIEVINPFNRQARQVIVSPERVHTMVFWSKNFGPFLAGRYGEHLRDEGYHLFFNFTVNSRSPILEPGVPDLDQRLGQLRQLCHRFGSASVQWRFDPICHFSTHSGTNLTNLDDFETIAAAAGECGIDTCTTSFMDHYRKIERRTRNRITFVEPPAAERVKILLNMEKALSPLGIGLALCCEKNTLGQLPPESTIKAGACISGQRIMGVHGGRVSLRPDSGQRKASGCECTVSMDVGSYSLHPCHHNCQFCYANPASDQRRHQ